MENNHRLLQFNQTIRVWIEAIDDYSLDQLRQQPREGTWSLGQVYRHILDDTEWFVGQMKAALETSENAQEEMHADARRMFLNGGFPDLQIRGPATDVYIPQPENKDELRQRLVAIQVEVSDLFAAPETADAGGKTRHPGLLFFSAGEWLQFAEMHMRHHLRQKARIDEALRTLPK